MSQPGASGLSHLHRWQFDIDKYVNRFLPNPPWRWLPRPVSHMLGYRPHPVPIMGNVLVAMWSVIGCFCGVALVSVVSTHVPVFEAHGFHAIVASFGAAAVLQFCAIDSPLGQPRNAVLGQLIAAFVGVAISKLFNLNPHAKAYPELGGALACGLTTAIMVLTHTVHPPAGATALLAVTSSPQPGWFLIPVMMLGCGLMLTTALIINNIQRRYPTHWWTARDLRPAPAAEQVDEEKLEHKATITMPSQYEESLTDDIPHLIIQRGEMFISDGISLTDEERAILEALSSRI